jgi:zinc/manganese transport system substrate-binding protein
MNKPSHRRHGALPALLLATLSALTGTTTVAAEPLRVVATTASLGMLAREVGGEAVRVRVLAPPDRDAHHLDARPSFMAALRQAELLLEVGAGLEEGWLPAAEKGAANPAIAVGRAGRLRAADHLELRPSITMQGPNLGHRHPDGNPHFQADPGRLGSLALALAERLGQLRPPQAATFTERAGALHAQLAAQAQRLAEGIASGQRMVVYHEDLDYLQAWLPVEVVGYLEPAPGIPPSAGHLEGLVSRLAGGQGRILHARFQPERGGEFLRQRLGWPVCKVPLEPPLEAQLTDYLQLMETWSGCFEAKASAAP